MTRTLAVLTSLLSAAACGGEAQIQDPDEQVAQALVAAPADKADGATVMGFATDGSFVEIRSGTNDLICQADDPADHRFSSSCYHESLAPYFARGRELDAEGSPRDDRYRIRFDEMESGELASPVMGAAQYIFDGTWDAASRTASGAVRWIIYMPGATPASTGLSEQPVEGGPWLMFSGTPGAHIMIVPPREG